MPQNLLEIKNANAEIDGNIILREINFSIKPAEIILITGPNGAGKSVLLKSIFGIIPFKSGDFRLPEKNIISYLPQEKKVFLNLTVKDNLRIGGFKIKNKKDLESRIKELTDMFPFLKNNLNQKVKNLSGGEQQITALARALMMRPKILLLDEPSLGLSEKITQEFFAQLKLVHKKTKLAIIIVEHNHSGINGLNPKTYLIKDQKISPIKNAF